MSRRLAVAAAALVAAATAGCTSAAGGQGSSSPAGAPATTDTAAPSSVSAPPSVTASPSSTAPSSSSAPATTSAAASPKPVVVTVRPTVAPRSTCHSLTVRVIRGSADRGREFAALQFTNDGTSSCTLYGYPTVTLTRGGKQIGSVSQPDSTASSKYVLTPGDTAESQLNDYTDCQAPLSDTIRVVVPGSSQTTSRPGELRACTLRVSRLGRPS